MGRSITGKLSPRKRLPFSAVNRRGNAGYQPGMQRHHLLPREVLSKRVFERLFHAVKVRTLGFEDFRRNGLLLPSEEVLAQRLGLPLHRGPHPDYNAMVVAQIGEIEFDWARRKTRKPKLARIIARTRLIYLQRSLRLKLLSAKPPPVAISDTEEIGSKFNFTDLDAMANQLWSATQSTVDISSLSKKDDRAD